MQNFSPVNSSNTHTYIEHSVAQERIRQARNTSNLALIFTTFSTTLSIVGACTLFSGKLSIGTITAASGLASSIHCIRLANDANDRLDRLLIELNKEK